MKVRGQIGMVMDLDLVSAAGNDCLPPGPSLPSGGRDEVSDALVTRTQEAAA